jgi:hypothetical protein
MLEKTRTLRIALLLLVLFVVAMNSWLSQRRATEWRSPLWVALYPVNGDGSAHTTEYIRGLSAERFSPLEQFFSEEGARYSLMVDRPVVIKLAPEIRELPPAAPLHGSMLEVVLWSLRLRYWTWRVDNFKGPANARIFVVFHDPQLNNHLAHSTGLQKGMVGIVNAFADTPMEGSNNVVIAHEFLHLLGARDKYDLNNNLPLFPAGYAEPELEPRLPQNFAELMAGRIPLAGNEASIPESLQSVLIGEVTAREINWLPTL